jgi:O-antigen/teichoic acid export membrane protein
MRWTVIPTPLRNMLIYAVSLFLAKGMSLLLLPFIATYLSPSQLGQLELLATTTVFLCLLVGFAMHENLYRFVGEIKEPKKQFKKVCELYSYAILLSVVVGSILTLILLLSPSIQGIFSPQIVALICIVLAFESALGISTAWLRFQDKAHTFFFVSIVSSILQVTGVVLVLVYFPTVTNIFAVGVFTSLTQLLVLHFINRFNWVWNGFTNLLLMLRYSSPLMLSAVVAFGLSGAEKWIIGYSVSVEVLGLYAVAAKFSLAMCILIQPFGMWWMPKRFNALSTKGATYTAQVTQVGILYISLLALVVGSLSQLFILFALPKAFISATSLVSGVIAVAIFKELAELVNVGILEQKKTRWILYINITCTIMGLALSWLLTTHALFSGLGIWSVVIAIAIAQACRAALLLFYSQRLNPLPYQFHALILIIVSTLGCLALNQTTTNSFGLMIIALIGAAFNLIVAIQFKFFSVFNLAKFPRLFAKQV